MMKRSMTIFAALFIAGIILLTQHAMAQNNLEVDGKAKVMMMDTNNYADSVVVRLSDGTLAVRDVSTLSGLSPTGSYGTVVNPKTGKVWLDRNLGATQVATSSSDPASYGNLYQWGRGTDGHQLRTSDTSQVQATNWLGSGSWYGQFITNVPAPYNWLSTEETQLWSGTSAENNPCPSGFRIPTNAEWNQERLTWISNDAAGAFASPIKLPAAGNRNAINGVLFNVGSIGDYWSSTASDTNARYLHIFSSNAEMIAWWRGSGFSVRCILD